MIDDVPDGGTRASGTGWGGFGALRGLGVFGGFFLLSVLIYDLNESGDLAAIAVLGLLMLVVTFVIVALANSLRGRNARRVNASLPTISPST